MKNKNILYALLGIGAIAGFYFWKKKKMPKTSSETKSNVVDNTAFSKEETEKLAKQYADDFVNQAKMNLQQLSLQPLPKVEQKGNSREEILTSSLGAERQKIVRQQLLNKLNKFSNSYGEVYLMFKNSIPKFKNIEDLNLAKNIFIKNIMSDNLSKDELTKEEQIFIANNSNLGQDFGFDTSLLFPQLIPNLKQSQN